jgi:hypothetical protein
MALNRPITSTPGVWTSSQGGRISSKKEVSVSVLAQSSSLELMPHPSSLQTIMSRGQCYKTFYVSNLRVCVKARVFAPGKPF